MTKLQEETEISRMVMGSFNTTFPVFNKWTSKYMEHLNNTMKKHHVVDNLFFYWRIDVFFKTTKNIFENQSYLSLNKYQRTCIIEIQSLLTIEQVNFNEFQWVSIIHIMILTTVQLIKKQRIGILKIPCISKFWNLNNLGQR